MRGVGSDAGYGWDGLGGVLGVGFMKEIGPLYWVLKCLAL